ncbi:MAG: c-type cytochrome [Anaerolineae bacterium]
MTKELGLFPTWLLLGLLLTGAVILVGCGGTPEPSPPEVVTPVMEPTVKAVAPPPHIPHDLEGRDNCRMCHEAGTVGAPTFPADHAELTNDVCQRCHVVAVQPIKIPAGVTIPHIPHDLIGRDDCLMCHKLGTSQAPRVPDDHAGLPSELCQSCHVAPVSARLSGPEIFAAICSRCHGQNGEGGVGVALNSKEFLSTHDDEAIHQAIISGRGGSEMLAWGDLGLLSDDQIDQLVTFIRSWEPAAPWRGTALGPGQASAALGSVSEGEVLFVRLCSGCHGLEGEKRVNGVILHSDELLASLDDVVLASQIRDGGKNMPAFHSLLTSDDINDLLALLRSWQTTALVSTPSAVVTPTVGVTPTAVATSIPSFAKDILPLLKARCSACHGSLGGWSAASHDEVVNSGDNGPAVIPGDAEASLLLQKLKGTQTIGSPMPPGQSLSAAEISLVENWIAAGAPDN